MSEGTALLLGKSANAELQLLPAMANRHGLLTGEVVARTRAAYLLAERLTRAGVPVFASDLTGDLPALSQAVPTVFWGVFGETGHPLRVTVSDLGPLLLSRMLGLNATQAATLTVVFRVADEGGLLLLDVSDLRAMLRHVAANAAEVGVSYGTVSTSSIGAIQRALLGLEEQLEGRLFGEPALDVSDLLRTDSLSRGCVSILAAERLAASPVVFSTLQLWLLSELYERLPERGAASDSTPELVFLFDEARRLFDGASPALLAKVLQLLRGLRVRGIGVFFLTEKPTDIPSQVFSLLGNRIELLAEGEANVTLATVDGSTPTPEKATLVAPSVAPGPITPEQRRRVMECSPVAGKYDEPVDRESAAELLSARPQAPAAKRTDDGAWWKWRGSGTSRREGLWEAMGKSTARAAGGELGRQVIRGILGTLIKGAVTA